MKRFKIEFCLELIPTLTVIIMSALVVTIFSTTMSMANADSFPFSPISPTSVQSQLQQHQQQQDIITPMITTNSNELRLTDHPFPVPMIPLVGCS